MRAGRLRHRLTFEEGAASKDVHGQAIRVWNGVGTRWGSVEPLSGKENYTAEQTQGRVTHKITIRNRPPVLTVPSNQLRVRWAVTGKPVRIFNITTSLNWQERGVESHVLAEEAVGVLT